MNLADLEAYSSEARSIVIVNICSLHDRAGAASSRALLRRWPSARRFPFLRQWRRPGAVLRVGQMALEYRQAFASDVVVDLIGYRGMATAKWTTRPSRSRSCTRKIKDHSPLWQIYCEADRLGPGFDH